MTTVTVDRFGRIVIPKEVRRQHGLRPGSVMEWSDSPHGLTLATPGSPAAPPGRAWRDGMLVIKADVVGDITDVVAFRYALDDQRDQELGGF